MQYNMLFHKRWITEEDVWNEKGGRKKYESD